MHTVPYLLKLTHCRNFAYSTPGSRKTSKIATDSMSPVQWTEGICTGNVLPVVEGLVVLNLEFWPV